VFASAISSWPGSCLIYPRIKLADAERQKIAEQQARRSSGDRRETRELEYAACRGQHMDEQCGRQRGRGEEPSARTLQIPVRSACLPRSAGKPERREGTARRSSNAKTAPVDAKPQPGCHTMSPVPRVRPIMTKPIIAAAKDQSLNSTQRWLGTAKLDRRQGSDKVAAASRVIPVPGARGAPKAAR
jgi:hypothetical protein